MILLFDKQLPETSETVHIEMAHLQQFLLCLDLDVLQSVATRLGIDPIWR